MNSSVQPLVDVANVRRLFPTGAAQAVAVNGISCQIGFRDRVALVGRSGSGKSTLLHLMAGIDQPTSGKISWPALGDAASLRPDKIGMVFQSHSLIGWLDVAENVALPLQLCGSARQARTRAITALARFDLDHLADKLPEELSGGQAQRVSLVRATVNRPKLLFADEPTGQLDHKTATILIDMLLEWAEQDDVAIVIATHDLSVAQRFSKIWTMQDGMLDTQETGALA